MNSLRIIFKNQPKLSVDVVDEKFNKRRLALISVIESYLSASKYFTGDVNVTFSHRGISSLVCFIESSEGKRVLKIALSITHSAGEALFLKTWEKAGVKVPHVFDSGYFGEHPYTLMEYIDSETVSDLYTHEQMVNKGLYLEMGTILRHMHEPQGTGYGMVVGDRGEYKTFKEWVDGPDMQKRIVYVAEHNLLPSVWHLFSRAIDVLVDYAGREGATSYCHDDFGGGNVLATKPLTVFDPNSRFNNRYIDISRTMVLYLADDLFPKEILDGYFSGEVCNDKVLYASMFLNIVMKTPYSHKKGRLDTLKNWEGYLVSNKKLLERF